MPGSDLLSGLWRATEPPRLSPHDWELLIGQARATRLLARLARHYEQPGWWAAVPAPCRPHLQSALRVADHLSSDVLWETDHLVQALRDLPTPVVLLKGAAYVAAGLPPGRGRLFSDIDILVSRASLREVELHLFGAGWIPEKLQAYDDRYYRQWMHELPPLQHVQRRSCLDVHHSIAPPTSRFVIDGASLLARAIPLATEPRLSVLAPADMVLHSAVHLMQEGDFGAGLRDLLDLNDLLRHFDQTPGFREELVARSLELGVQALMAHALKQVARLFGTDMSLHGSGAPGRFEAGGSREFMMNRLLELALRPVHFSCDTTGARVARGLLYVRSHWLRMPWYQIAPHLSRKAWARIVNNFTTRDPVGAKPGP